MGWFGNKDGKKRQAATVQLAAAAEPYNSAPLEVTTTTINQYVAPSPVQTPANQLSLSGGHQPVTREPIDLVDDDIVIVENRQRTEDDFGDVENPTSTTESRNGESEPEARSYGINPKNTHLNSLFNGHLMKWKIEAEEGTSFVRIPACKYYLKAMYSI
jgi:hypothetical protein